MKIFQGMLGVVHLRASVAARIAHGTRHIHGKHNGLLGGSGGVFIFKTPKRASVWSVCTVTSISASEGKRLKEADGRVKRGIMNFETLNLAVWSRVLIKRREVLRVGLQPLKPPLTG